MQRQHDLTQEMIQSGQALHDSQSIISVQSLEQLARELVRLCDDVEKHGLVDYQMGVAEEVIMDRKLYLSDGAYHVLANTGNSPSPLPSSS